MNKILLLIFTAFSISFVLNSCTNTNNTNSSQQPNPVFSGADSTEVLDLVKDYMTKVQNKDYDGAVSMLYDFYSDSIIHELSDSAKLKMIAQHKVFPVLKYNVVHLDVYDYQNVSVTCSIQFFEKDPNDSIQNTIRIAFDSRCVNNEWKLAIKEY